MRDGIVLKNVSYRYPDSGRPSLKGISATIRKGESIGVVGESGAGKTTLVDVLLGLIEPTEGALLIDGVSCDTLSPAWRNHVGYVPQEIYLTDDTVRANVAFGLPAEEIDDDAIWRALRMARMEEYVEGLSNGLDTVIGERGGRLSGGQRQRIGIARALYHDPDILILDEATSALDMETEKHITETIQAFLGLKTLIVIAHRLTSLRYCGRVLYLKDGSLVDEGDFAALTARNEEFRQLMALSREPLAG